MERVERDRVGAVGGGWTYKDICFVHIVHVHVVHIVVVNVAKHRWPSYLNDL